MSPYIFFFFFSITWFLSDLCSSYEFNAWLSLSAEAGHWNFEILYLMLVKKLRSDGMLNDIILHLYISQGVLHPASIKSSSTYLCNVFSSISIFNYFSSALFSVHKFLISLIIKSTQIFILLFGITNESILLISFSLLVYRNKIYNFAEFVFHY